MDHLRPQTLGFWVHQLSVFWSFLTNFPRASDSHVGFGGGVTQCLLALKPSCLCAIIPTPWHVLRRSRQCASAMELSILEEPASPCSAFRTLLEGPGRGPLVIPPDSPLHFPPVPSRRTLKRRQGKKGVLHNFLVSYLNGNFDLRSQAFTT